MTFNKMSRNFLFAATAISFVCLQTALANETKYETGGNSKVRLLGQTFSGDSIFNTLTGPSALDVEADVRLNLMAGNGPWRIDIAYQLFAAYGDRIEYTRLLPDQTAALFRLPNDDRRLFDLTDVLKDDDKFAVLHRLDRVSVSYRSEKVVIKLGRQAISWGNGLFFSPLDIVNPFDPAAIDTEYKPGDDMLYGQYLTENGDDIQAAMVLRRDPLTGVNESGEDSYAMKYHGIVGESEYDLLLADSYGNTTIGIGGNRSIGGAIWRGDVIVTDADSGAETEFVTNLSYSWIWSGKNVSGAVEYYFNGFGKKNGRYSLAQNSELLNRLIRGQTFSLGRHYIASGLSIELSPLWMLTPNIFANLEDGSALLQILTQNNLSDNLTFLGALNIAIGPDGTEYGGIRVGNSELFFSNDVSFFAQLAFYF